METDFANALMRQAIRLGRQGIGRTAENPSVGCVILSADGEIVGAGRTRDGGRPHAEINALEQAGQRAINGTAVVTLEPCSHTGKSGPCADALIRSGIKSLIIGTSDPDPRVAGRGIAKLDAAGITVQTGVCEGECRQSMRGFLSRIEKQRPFVSLKVATTLDGRTALSNGESKWITGPAARRYVHMQRAQADAIMVGASTIKADQPSLNVRLDGLENLSPRPVILDTRSSLSEKMMKCDYPTALYFTAENTPTPNGALCLRHVMKTLADKGINNLYVESGGKLATSLLQLDLVDELIWFRSAKLFGADAKSAIADLGLTEVCDAKRFTCVHRQIFDDDLMEIFQPCSQD